MDDSTLEAKWYINNDTGEEYLIDLKTGDVIMSRAELNKPDPLWGWQP